MNTTSETQDNMVKYHKPFVPIFLKFSGYIDNPLSINLTNEMQTGYSNTSRVLTSVYAPTDNLPASINAYKQALREKFCTLTILL